ncbi:MAG: VTT domain-containing protein [Nocardioides sp.]|jgi:membrane protein DedA with SNARE-associated domain
MPLVAAPFADWPIAATWVFFLGGSLARGTALYWMGRGARTVDSRWRGLLDRPSVRRAERVVARFGAPLVAASFLTVGVQTAVNVAAGGLQMPGRRYVPALVVGSMAWATIYTTVGWAVIEAFWGRESTWWVVSATLGVLLTATATMWARRKFGLRALPEGDEPE